MTETTNKTGVAQPKYTVEGKVHNVTPMLYMNAWRKLNSLLLKQKDKRGSLVVCEDGTVTWLPDCLIQLNFLDKIDGMIAEHNALERRRNTLRDYFLSEVFNDLDNVDQYLLLNQYTAMGDYLSILRMRIERLSTKQ